MVLKLLEMFPDLPQRHMTRIHSFNREFGAVIAEKTVASLQEISESVSVVLKERPKVKPEQIISLNNS